MNGWIWFALIAGGCAGLLWATGFPRRLWMLPATALMLGAAGYVWQARPMLPGHPVAADSEPGVVDPNFVALRESLFGRFNLEQSYFGAADAMIRSGSPETAATVMLGGVRKVPEDAALWAGLGLAIAEMDGMHVSPAAKFALDRAVALAPLHPGPPFFYGLALVREGRFAEARPWWAKAVALAPATASYHRELAGRLYLLDRLLAQAEGKPAPPVQPEAPTPEPEVTPAPAPAPQR